MTKSTRSKYVQAIIQLGTAMTALLGLLLGIINTTAMLEKEKVKVEIIPMAYVNINQNTCLTTKAEEFHALPIKDQELIKTSGILAFTIINKSAFSIEISDIGIAKEKRLASDRIFIRRPYIIFAPEHLSNRIDLYSLYPIHLGSREAITLLMPEPKENNTAFDGHKYIYARTMCEETFYANASKVLNILSNSKSVNK